LIDRVVSIMGQMCFLATLQLWQIYLANIIPHLADEYLLSHVISVRCVFLRNIRVMITIKVWSISCSLILILRTHFVKPKVVSIYLRFTIIDFHDTLTLTWPSGDLGIQHSSLTICVRVLFSSNNFVINQWIYFNVA